MMGFVMEISLETEGDRDKEINKRSMLRGTHCLVHILIITMTAAIRIGSSSDVLLG